ncbi:hypothetical protein AQJ23_14230 [Streptomyces antibioticus]|nr:hypothetical protein [Streptomyces antibioticus]KUN26328.1 hypothetical protein AQJ23_14230 [Streptomyces antibioticus]
MDVLISVFLVLHFVGIVVLLGGFLTQVKAMNQGTARFSPLMLRGALAMLGTGVILVALNKADDQSLNSVKLAVKLAVLVVILGLVYVKRDETRVDKALFSAVPALVVVNVLIATLWS